MANKTKSEMLEQVLRQLANNLKEGSATPKQAIEYLPVLHVWFHQPELLKEGPETEDSGSNPGGGNPPPPPPGSNNP